MKLNRKLSTAMTLAVAMGWAVSAGAIDFPATGLTTAYTADKNDKIPGPVAVPDDGTVEAGATLSYTDNGDGTITDNNTGLTWEKKSDDGGLHDKDSAFPWSGNGSQDTVWDWLDDVNAEGGTGFAGYNDWRMPNLKELQSLVHFERSSPMTSTAFHNNCGAGATVLTGSCTLVEVYWTSTTRAQYPTKAWSVSFTDGTLPTQDKTLALRVRAVRGGGSGPQAFPATGQLTAYTAEKNDGIPGPVSVPDDGTIQAGAPLSFTDNGNGTITDNNTGLVWEKKGDNGGLHDKDNPYWWSSTQETIWDWLEDVNAEGGTGFAGSNDWRIPNAREILSLMDFGKTWPVPAAFHTNCAAGVSVLTGSCTLQVSYWTSTSRVFAIPAAWTLTTNGELLAQLKSGPQRVRAVRGGTP